MRAIQVPKFNVGERRERFKQAASFKSGLRRLDTMDIPIKFWKTS